MQPTVIPIIKVNPRTSVQRLHEWELAYNICSCWILRSCFYLVRVCSGW